jgi:hypothetical protein
MQQASRRTFAGYLPATSSASGLAISTDAQRIAYRYAVPSGRAHLPLLSQGEERARRRRTDESPPARLLHPGGRKDRGRDAALVMIEQVPGDQPITVGADKAYDTKDFVAEARGMNATPHVAQNNKGRRSAIDGRTTRHAGYALSQQKRKAGRRDLRLDEDSRGNAKAAASWAAVGGMMFTFAAAAYNLVRIRNLVTANAEGKA